MTTPPTPAPESRRGVLVLGANGRFGAAAVRAFHAAGWSVFAQVRRAPAVAWPAGVDAVALPLADIEALARAAGGATVVVHAVNPLYTRWDEEAMPLLEAGLAVARRLGARFMLPGNVYNFGAGMPARLHEDTPQRPTTRKGEQRVAMEAAIGRASAASGLPASVIRAGDYFGGGTGSWLDLVIAKSLHEGKLVYPGPLELAHAWAYLPDLARAFVAVAERGDAGFRCWHFAGHGVTGREWLAALQAAAQSLGIAPRRGWRVGGMPWRLVALVGVVYPLWRELARMAYLWRVPHVLDGTALDALPGVTHTPLVAALRESLIALGFVPPAAAAAPAPA